MASSVTVLRFRYLEILSRFETSGRGEGNERSFLGFGWVQSYRNQTLCICTS